MSSHIFAIETLHEFVKVPLLPLTRFLIKFTSNLKTTYSRPSFREDFGPSEIYIDELKNDRSKTAPPRTVTPQDNSPLDSPTLRQSHFRQRHRYCDFFLNNLNYS